MPAPLQPNRSTSTAGTSNCSVTVTSAAAACNNCSFRVDATDATAFALSVNESAARLLNQATFGATNAELDAFALAHSDVTSTAADAAASWVATQMALPATFFREYYRARTNPRILTDTQAGRIIRACEIGSRWHRYAFNSRDLYEKITVSHERAGYWSLRILGALRTEGPL